jgi:hypothetical protein
VDRTPTTWTRELADLGASADLGDPDGGELVTRTRDPRRPGRYRCYRCDRELTARIVVNDPGKPPHIVCGLGHIGGFPTLGVMVEAPRCQ